MNKYDKIIIGGGLYGLYSAWYCAQKGEKILVLECDKEPFQRATHSNQARVHMGYHYPRSYSTAIKSKKYFDSFVEDYGFSINSKFQKIYAISKKYSWTNGEQFVKFCKDTNIPCEPIKTSSYFNDYMCDGAYVTEEYTYDAQILRDYFMEELKPYNNVEIKFGIDIQTMTIVDEDYHIATNTGIYVSDFVLNATYASVNQILNKVGLESFDIKYELCEIILCKTNEELDGVGITVMDGPFFSIMPFGKTGYHSLTSVTFTPHIASYDTLPTFPCQKQSGGYCSPEKLGNCNLCKAKPKTSWEYMSRLAKKYLKEDLQFEYVESLYSIKPILKSSEIDDSRPTVIKVNNDKPRFVSVLSGKINTMYDIKEVLDNE